MHAIFLTLTIASTPIAAYTTPDEAAASLVEELQTGTLLFSEGDCLAVKAFTASPYTHVAAIVVEDNQAFVFDSQNGVGVRKLHFEEYLAVTRPAELHVLQPKHTFDEEQAEAFHSHLQKEVGRPYAISHHLTGQRCEGLHCAEYATDALMTASLISAKRPPRVSPHTLRSGLLKHNLYMVTKTVAIAEEETAPVKGRNWCHQLWLETKDCCVGCWSCFNRSVLCR